MAYNFRLRWQGKRVDGNARTAIIRGIERTLDDCVAAAQERAPVAFGKLRDSIRKGQKRYGKQVFWREWGSYNVKYAFFVEVGTGPHMPPVQALVPWAALVLGDPAAAWPVAIKISREGTPAQPYLRPSADEHYPKLMSNVRDEWEKLT